MGQFTQLDPIGLAGGLNAYGFAGGDPINFSDPFGLCPEKETGRKCGLKDVFSVAFSFGFSVGASAALTKAVAGEFELQFGPNYTAEYSAEGIERETDTSPSSSVGVTVGYGAAGFRVTGDAEDGLQGGAHLLGEALGTDLPIVGPTGKVKVQAILGVEVRVSWAAIKEVVGGLFKKD